MSADEVLNRFTPATAEWFRGAFDEPTSAQIGAWDAISSGDNALVVAPTGSGKTLAAFLWALDGFLRDVPADSTSTPKARTRVLYISPLKALGVDVERNLRSPLIGITQTAARLNATDGHTSKAADIRVGVRSGDTTARDRRRLITDPPDILITTPESLYLMLTSRARETLTGIETVIIDEVHALAGNKRGAHLALSLERLDELVARAAIEAEQDRPKIQRIGLSATVKPIDQVARFLGGTQPVTIVAPKAAKSWELTVSVPVEDMTHLPEVPAVDATGGSGGNFDVTAGSSADDAQTRTSIWPHIEHRIIDLVSQYRSTIIFANSRRLAERLTQDLNDIWAARHADPDTGELPEGEDAPEEFARSHHGSVSKDQRALVEEGLKSGRLRCVVATSSLELGIDMGAVDLVIQVEAPPSVASSVQRVGRAGHQVGEVSIGWFFPKHRSDLLDTAVITERMREGAIEQLAIPANPLDVLAQHTVAAVAMEDWDAEAWFDLIRRAAPFTTLTHSVYESVLDLLAGKYPSDEFADLRPRVVWDREAGTLTTRPGSQRLAVTSGGTIPDRGLFGVFLADGSSSDGETGTEDEEEATSITTMDRTRGGRRVGELDEEMVYESRVGDVIILGTTTWKITEITHDRVLVVPAFGEPGRLPFWRGDAAGRPAELGQAIGAFRREIAHTTSDAATVERLTAAGLDEFARKNLTQYLTEQQESTGPRLPSDTTLVIERFRDELGDWRIVLHSPFGKAVHGPWALAITWRVREELGIDAHAMAADDGIVLRLPFGGGVDENTGTTNSSTDLFIFDTDELTDLVRSEVGSSALFASRFRENAARALLIPRRDPSKRSPLWQQRQRAAQLLSVASKYPQFPIILETVRECLQDVYDVPALQDLMNRIHAGTITVTEVETQQPSPFAQNLLFGYTAEFLYEADSPLAERRAAALSLDPALLAELLGSEELRQLLDPDVVSGVEADLQRLSDARKLPLGVESIADLLRMLGPLTREEVAARLVCDDTDDPSFARDVDEAIDTLIADKRALSVRIAGKQMVAAIEDAARLRDALGVALPMGVPVAFIEPVADPLGDLVSRYARTHGPFTASEVASRLGLGPGVVHSMLERLVAERRVSTGAFRPTPTPDPDQLGALTTQEFCDVEVLRRIRRRSLAALREAVEPVPATAFTRFMLDRHGLAPSPKAAPAETGVDGLAAVLDQLSGFSAPASAWENFILPSRVRDYRPDMLDQLLATGEFTFSGTPHGGTGGSGDQHIAFHHIESLPLTLRSPDDDAGASSPENLSAVHQAILEVLTGTGAWFFPALVERLNAQDESSPRYSSTSVLNALWDLLWAGRITNDTFAPVRAIIAGGGHSKNTSRTRARPTRPRTRRMGRGGRSDRLARLRRYQDFPLSTDNPEGTTSLTPDPHAAAAALLTPADQARSAGRWSVLPAEPSTDTTLRAHAAAEYLLDRYGVITRGSVTAENLPGGFGLYYKLLSRMEDAGQIRRGYFIEHLGAAQFSTAATINELRAVADAADNDAQASSGFAGRKNRRVQAIAVAATDPANPFGAALPWPDPPAGPDGDAEHKHRPGRKAGAIVVIVEGQLLWYLERGGKTLLQFPVDAGDIESLGDNEVPEEWLQAGAEALVTALQRATHAPTVAIQSINGASINAAHNTTVQNAKRSLKDAGFYSTPSAFRFRP